jgi:cytochrome oxidase Cu insertion factor (SCO1/SenC/PrrC family)
VTRRNGDPTPRPAGVPHAAGPTRAAAGVGRRLALGLAVTGVVVAALAAAGVAALRGTAPVPVADYGSAPRYTLTDQNGRAFRAGDLRGKVQVVSYLFPYCTSFCPLLMASLVQADHLLDGAGVGASVAFVAFNVDPAGAGPATLAAFLRQEHVDPADPGWHFLTGSPEQVRRVVTDGFHVFYQRVPLAEEERVEASQRAAGDFTPQPSAPNPLADRAGPDYDIVHNDVVEIVDGGGTVRAILAGGSPPTPEQIVAAVRRARSAPSG